MEKRNKIIYWSATLWLSLGMVSTAMVQLSGQKDGFTDRLGYPHYFITLLGIWKILGVIAILVPRKPLLKEWAYAGFFFAMSGAIFSHIASGAANEIFPSLLLLLLIIVSWYFRPSDRKIVSAHL